MEDNKKDKSDEIPKIFNNDPFLRSYSKLVKPRTEVMTEEQKKENFVKAIMDAGKTNQET